MVHETTHSLYIFSGPIEGCVGFEFLRCCHFSADATALAKSRRPINVFLSVGRSRVVIGSQFLGFAKLILMP